MDVLDDLAALDLGNLPVCSQQECEEQAIAVVFSLIPLRRGGNAINMAFGCAEHIVGCATVIGENAHAVSVQGVEYLERTHPRDEE